MNNAVANQIQQYHQQQQQLIQQQIILQHQQQQQQQQLQQQQTPQSNSPISSQQQQQQQPLTTLYPSNITSSILPYHQLITLPVKNQNQSLLTPITTTTSNNSTSTSSVQQSKTVELTKMTPTPVQTNSETNSKTTSDTTSSPNETTTNDTNTKIPTIIPSLPQITTPSSSSSSSSSIYSLNNTTTIKPEAKKVKTQKSQPSKVVHIRNIPQQISEIEVIQFGLIFGNIENVLNLRSKCQAFLEFEKCEEAQSMISYFTNNPISVAGRQIFVQYSNYKNLVTDPGNTNNQVAKAALDLAKDLHKSAQTGGQNTVLRAMVQNMLYGITLDTIYQIFNRYGAVLKIITFTKNDKFQALIQMKDAASTQAAKQALHGQNIYNACCTLHIDYSKLNTLNVKYNNEKSRDYTNPLLPAGDCPEHLALGPGGVMNNSIQLQMAAAAAAAAAAGYSTQIGQPHLPPSFQFNPSNAFMPFTGKYLRN
jgi:hypothetical protein